MKDIQLFLLTLLLHILLVSSSDFKICNCDVDFNINSENLYQRFLVLTENVNTYLA